MKKKPSSSKKAQSPRRRRHTFRIILEAQEMVVSYEPNWMADMAHFEYRSPHKPPRRIPVSETGYLSHFASMDEVAAAKSPQEFAREEARHLLRSQCRCPEDSRQLSLFP
jgi:hypothetical protein